MPIYRYVAKNEHGEAIKGKVESRSPSHASAILSSRGLLVISVKSIGESSLSMLTGFLQGVRHNDLVNFTRQLSTMITAGLPLATALSILEEQDNIAMSRLVANILKEIEGGNTFSKALDKQGDVFSRVYIQLVKAGEVGGMLDNVLARLADNMEKQKEFRAKTKGAMIYPVIVVISMIIVGFIMMIFVVPKLTEMFQDFGAELPLPTRIIMGISGFLVKFWWLFLAATAGGISAFKSFTKTEKGELAVDSLLLKIPVFGVLRQKIVLTEFARTLSLLMSAGVSLLEALEIVTEALTSVTYRHALKSASTQVEKGVSLSQSIARFDVFPSILHQMVAVGEETGKLDDVLLKLSTYFEAESQQAVKNLTAAMEPMIMIVLGLGVGLMVIAVIMPIYALTSQF